MTEKIKIGYVDFWRGFDPKNNYLTDMLFSIYGRDAIEIVDRDFDYLFFSCFGYRNLKYDCIKIFFTGENIVPDFNLCDYAIGVHEMSFGDRYIWLPFYYWYDNAYEKALRKHKYSDEYYLRRKFCCFVISNALADSKRREMISLLNGYKAIDSGGRYLNNIGGRVDDKLEFVSKYKFSLCFENSTATGYTTEKIVEGFAGNGVPIYWGNPDIAKEFNPDSFVNCNAYDSLEDALEFIKLLDHNDDLYLQYVKAPIFNRDSIGKKEIAAEKLKLFLKNIFEQDIAKAGRINKVGIGERYKKRLIFFRHGLSLYSMFLKMSDYFLNRKQH